MKEKKTLNNCDPRLRWVMDRVLKYFQLNDESLAVNMLERHNGRSKKRLQCFLSGHEKSSTVFYVYQTTYPKTFYKEVTIRKEIPRPQESSPQTSDKDNNSEDSGEEEKKKKKEPKKKKKLKKKPSKGGEGNFEDTEKEEKFGEDCEGDRKPSEEEDNSPLEQDGPVQSENVEQADSDTKEAESSKVKKSNKSGKSKKRPKSPASVVETLPSDQVERPEQAATMTIKIKRIIRKEKKLSQLHLRIGPIPWNNIRSDLIYVYFLLRNTSSVPLFQSYQEANNEMPKYFCVGQLKESILEIFLKHIQIFHIYCSAFLTDPFDEVSVQTEGLEKFLQHRRKEKGQCPTTEAYRTADSFEIRLNTLQRSLGVEGDVIPHIKRSLLLNPEERQDTQMKIVQFPSIVNMDPTDVAIHDRPDLIELVVKLKGAIPHGINKCPSSVSSRKQQSLKIYLLESLRELKNTMTRCMEISTTSNSFNVSSMPELAHLSIKKVQELTTNETCIQHLEKIVQTGAKYIEDILKKYRGTPPDGKGPLPLYEYWALRHERLSLFMEECHQPIIDNILVVLSRVKSPFGKDFTTARRSLDNYYNLCSDNVEYLKSTLTELKVLSRSKRLKEITRVVSDIVEGLRVMWVLSTYWGSEPHFVELLARIRWVICHKVTQILNVPKLFRLGNDVARVICQDAIELMDVWKNSYSKTRSVIEKTRCEQRWEFERDLLFQETEYISQVANSLLGIINVVKNYEDIFCQQFINTVRDGSKIDSIVHKVKDLTLPLITADFNVFDREYAENWKILLECFWSDMKTLENEAIRVIRHSFTNLRSSVKATELLIDLRIVISSEKLDRLLVNQFEAVSAQFSNEVKGVMDVFIEYRENPPLLKYHELYSGSVYWSRSLYCAIRDTIVLLQNVPDVLKTLRFREALDDYTGFVDMISFYEKSIFVQMLHKYLVVVPQVFEKTIIKIVKKKDPREGDEYAEYWEWIVKKKSAKRLPALRLASQMEGGKKRKKTVSIKKPVKRTIEQDLRGVSGSSSMSDSSCTSAMSSDYSSADESDILSLVSATESLNEFLPANKTDEDVEIPEIASLIMARTPTPIKVNKQARKMLKRKDIVEPRGSVVETNAYPLGDGVCKPISEILKVSDLTPKQKHVNLLRQKPFLSSYHTTYHQASSESTALETEDSEGTDEPETRTVFGFEVDKQPRVTSNELLSPACPSAFEKTSDKTGDIRVGQSRRKYSNAYLKSLIQLARTKQLLVPSKPKKCTVTTYKTNVDESGSLAKHSSGFNKVESLTPESELDAIFEKNINDVPKSRTVNVAITCRPSSGNLNRKDSSSLSSGSDQSCDTESSYTTQQLKRKLMLKNVSSRFQPDSHDHASNDADGSDTSTSDGLLTDEGSDKVDKIEHCGRISPEGKVVGEVQTDVPSPEVAVVVARDIYNGVPKNVAGLTPKFVDGFLPPSQLSHPSTYSPTRAIDKTVSSEKSKKGKGRRKTWMRRTKPITYWQNDENDTCSSESSYNSTSRPIIQKSRFASYRHHQEEYKSKRINFDHNVKITDVDDISEYGKKAKRIDKKAALGTQTSTHSITASPTKSAKSLVSAVPTIPTKMSKQGELIAMVYSGCRHDVKRFSWHEFMGTDILVEHGYSIQINYSDMYECAIHEIELFEELGYEIPDDLRHISVIKNSLHRDVECGVKMVRKYTSILENLRPTQIAALKQHIGSIEKTMYFGLTQYTWSSLNIAEFCNSVMSQLNNLEYLSFQLQYMETCIEAIISKIIEIDSFQSPTTDVYQFQLFFKYCDYRRNEAMKVIKKFYNQITLILYKMECLLFSQMTGCSEHLLLYYIWTENVLFNGLVSHVLRNLEKYEEFLLGTIKSQFSIEANFEDKMIYLKPELALVAHELSSQAENIIGTLSVLVRWQEGTCHFVPQLKSSNSGSVHRFSFVEDLIQCREVKISLDHIYETVSVVIEGIEQYMEKWTKCSHLWTFDKEKTMRKFLIEEPTLAEYDECFSCYQSTIEELKSSKPAASINCARIRVKTMSQMILNIGLEWKSMMGDQLLGSSRSHAEDMRRRTKELHDQLAQAIVSLETFQSVLQAINDCSSYQVEAELSLKEIHGRHHLLRMWKVEIPEEDEQIAQDVENGWHEIRRIAAYRTHLLAPTMKLFVTKAMEVCDLFSKTSLVFGKKYFNEGPGTYTNDLDRGLDILQSYEVEFAEMEAKRLKMVQAEKLFDLQPMNFDVFCEAHQILKFELKVFDIYRRQKDEKKTWTMLLWNNFNPHKYLVRINSYLNEFGELEEKCRNMPIAKAIQKHMENFKRSIPLMVDLQNKALRTRHWDELMLKTKHEFTMDLLHTKMKDLFSMKLHEHFSLVAEIIFNAEREATIQTKLCSISETWSDAELIIVQHYKSNGDDDVHYTLANLDETIILMEDSIEDILTMSQSKFSGPFKDLIQEWSLNLSEALDVLKQWEKVQRDWTNLERIFYTNPGAGILQNDAAIFKAVDSAYLELTRKSKSRPNVFMQCLQPNRKEELSKISEDLEFCKKNLLNYVNTKRAVCPRFCFLMDEEMLELLGSTSGMPVQCLLTKMFVGVESLLLDEQDGNEAMACSNTSTESPKVVGMISTEGERLLFCNCVSTQNAMDTFMEHILKEMKWSLKYLTHEAVLDLPNSRYNRKEWASKHLGSTVLTSSQVWFCATVEEAFSQINAGNPKAMRRLLVKLNRQLDEDMRVIRSQLENNERKKLTTLLVQDAHSRDVIERFIAFNVVNAEEFEWTSQLRFHWLDHVPTLEVRQCEGNFEYGFEYMGLVMRQVITPLTERTRLTITQAMTMKQGTNILGPTATGKKETIKDLAVALGTMCIVINCGQLLAYSDFAQILRTISSCGIWACFDKVDRLHLSTLSLISSSIFSLRQALLAGMDSFYCESQYVKLLHTANVFITMNPGYRGRLPLPESINVLFRPVACMCPDTEQICTITLISEGFTDAKLLARKMNCLYKLAKTQLTRSDHYDFGLKIIKSVLCIAGSLKRDNPSMPENLLLMRALRDAFIPKLLKDDEDFFRGLLNDVFPNKEQMEGRNDELESTIIKCLDAVGLIHIPSQTEKLVQLHTILEMWHSVILVGSTSGGKSVIIDTFVDVLNKLQRPAQKMILNPNICSLTELYGHYLPCSREWQDGILTHLFKVSNTQPGEVFIVFDGAMDSEWAENLSSVMDNNRTLTLCNGDRIRLETHCSLLFETGNLTNCSPATVSRTGMVYVDAEDLGYDPYWKRWIQSRMEEDEANILQMLYEQFVPKCISQIIKGCLRTEVALTPLNMLTHLCVFIESQLPIVEPPYTSDVEEPIKRSPTRKQELTCIFIQALYLSLGAILTDKCKIPFDEMVKDLSKMPLLNEDQGSTVSCCNLPCGYPTLYEYKFDIEHKHWVPWSSFVEKYDHDTSQKSFNILVPNEEFTKMLWALDLLCKHNCEDIEYHKFNYREKIRPKVKRPILLIGQSGSAKTSIMRLHLNSLDKTKYDRLVVNLTPRTCSNKLQYLIERQLTRTMRNIYAPPSNKTLMAFIDDLDMAMNNQRGANETYAFLKFIIERQAMYGRGSDKKMVHVKNIYFIGALGKQQTNIKDIDPRFLSLFAIYRMNTITSKTLRNIFGSILEGHTDQFSKDIKYLVKPLIDTTLSLHNVARSTFLPSPFKFHYIYNVRDLTHIFSSLLMTRKELYTDVRHFLRAWRNEFTRVICDRLMNDEDRAVMYNHINDAISSRFPESHRYVMREPLLFGDFRNAMIKTETRKYEDLLDYEAVFHLFTEVGKLSWEYETRDISGTLFLYHFIAKGRSDRKIPTTDIIMSFNKENERMNLILFEDALEHLTRIHRSLRLSRGHILLLGAANSGKRSLTKLASYTAMCHVSTLTLRRYHSYECFWDTISALTEEIGITQQRTTFLVASEHPIPGEYLEVLNEIITNHSISTVLTEKQKEIVTERFLETSKKDKIMDKDKAFELFTECCLNNLHIVLSMAPVDAEFKKNCSLYPGLIRHSYIDWVFPWPRKALHMIANTLLKDVEILPETLKPAIIKSTVHVHHSTVGYIADYSRKNGIRCYLSPRHFLAFIKDYLQMISDSQKHYSLQSENLIRGLKKLEESTATLAALNRRLAERKQLINDKIAEIDGLSEKILGAEDELNVKSEESKEMTLQATTLKKMMYKQEAEIEDLMNKATPQLYSGRRALSELDQDSISSMCASAVVPEPVQVVCESIAILRGSGKLDWPSIKEYVDDPFVLTKLREMDFTAISEETVLKIRTRLRSSRRMGEMEQISASGHGLLKYLEAIMNFCHIYKDVKPLQKRAKELEKQWNKLTCDVDTANEEIAHLERAIHEMKVNLNRGTAEQTTMNEETTQMDFELGAANSLFNSMKEDSIRWKRKLDEITYEIKNVFGDCLLGAAFLNYTSVFDHQQRQMMLYADWKVLLESKFIQTTQYFTVESHMTDNHSINRWLAEGIPRDNHAVQNVILMKRSSKYPICIDPDQQMLKWILSHEEDNGIRRISTNDPSLTDDISTAVVMGKPLMLYEFEFLNHILEEILLKNQDDNEGSALITINNQLVPLNVNFRLYLVISSFQPTLDPSVFANAMVIDCSMKSEAIEDKSLEVAMMCYQRVMEEERCTLTRHRCSLMQDLQKLQTNILQQIAHYDGNIFDDFPYIQSLIELKCKANHVQVEMSNESIRIDEVDAQRSEYAALAKRSAVMFQAFNGLRKVNPLNATSFQTFMQVLERVLDQLRAESLAQKLETLTRRLYDYQSKGLKSNDKLLYAFHLAIALEIMQRRITEKQLRYFLEPPRVSTAGNSSYSWMTDMQWRCLQELAKEFPASFVPIIETMKTNEEEWKEWMARRRDNTNHQLPCGYEKYFDSKIELLLLLKCLRVDAVHGAIMDFVKGVLGENFLTPFTTRLEDLLPFTTNGTPVLIHICPGTDQFSELLALSNKNYGSDNLLHVAIGSGSEELVAVKLTEAMTNGKWLLIQNCHLLPSFMFQLYQMFFDHVEKHVNFRLWLTTEDISDFQLQFVLLSHKVVIEALSPVKLNLLETYSSLDSDEIASCVHPAFPSTVFSLAFFHAVIEERKKFGKHGYNMTYNFTKSDLHVSLTIIKQYLNKIFYKENCKIPWVSLRYFIGEVVYGGRVTDDYDRRIVNTYINEYFGDFILESAKPFKFSRSGETCQYPLPPVGEKKNYIDCIRSLPLLSEPSVFGIHENQQREVDVDVAKYLCNKLALISCDGDNDDLAFSDSEQRQVMDVAAKIISKIPVRFRILKQESSLEPNPKPTAMCLLRELKTFNCLVDLLETTMDSIQKVTIGMSIMTEATDELRRSLLNDSPPHVWMKFSPKTNHNIANWLAHFQKRCLQLETWVSRGEPWILWLSGLTYPEAYLTAVTQVACREEGWQIDSVAMNTQVTNFKKRSEIPSKPKTGFYVEGLFLDGASWDTNQKCLAASRFNTNLDPLPIIGLFPTPVRGLSKQNSITLPLYTTSRRRENLEEGAIAELNVPTKKHESYWILENVCVVMNTD